MLQALNVSTLEDSQLFYVTGRRRYFRWDASSTAAALSGEVVVPTSAPAAGRFISVDWTTSIENALQAAWTIDPVNGSDDAAAGPLATFQEYARRVPVLFISQTVTIAATLPDSDNLVYEPQVHWMQSLSATYPTLTITGTRSLGANNATVSSSDETGNAAPLIDIGIALTPGTIIQATSGAVNGSTAVVLAVIAGTQFRTSPWNTAAFARSAPPSVADTVAVVTLPTINNIGITANTVGTLTFSNLNIKNIRSMGSATGSAFFDICTFGLAQAISPPAGTAWIFRGSACSTSGIMQAASAGCGLQFRQAGIIRPTDTISCAGLSRAEFTNTVVQSGNIDIGTPGFVGAGLSTLFISSLGIFGVNAGINLLARRSAGGSIEGTLYGPNPGGASVGTAVREGGNLKVKSTVTPTLTGATELIFEGAGTAIPALAAGGAVPAASALATWANWTAGPFNRDVMSYKSAGCGINNYV